jgi:hypothetical protein
MLVLDSGGITRMAERSRSAVAFIRAMRDQGLWPPFVSTAALVESLTGDPPKDANTNRFLKTCNLVERLPERMARRVAYLRTRARRGSAIDAIVMATAEPGGTVITSDPADLRAIATRADDVAIEAI